jgi:hypothetical protein
VVEWSEACLTCLRCRQPLGLADPPQKLPETLRTADAAAAIRHRANGA